MKSPRRSPADVKSDVKHERTSPTARDVTSPRKDVLRNTSPKSTHASKLESRNSSESKSSANASLELEHKLAASSSASSSPAALASHPLSASKLPLPHAALLSSYYSHLPLPGYPFSSGLSPLLGADAMTLLAQRTKDSAPHVATTYNPVKTASGATTFVPVCSDPQCVICKLAMHSAQLAHACSAGCTQCSRERSLSALNPALAAASYMSPLGLGGLQSLSSLYAHHHATAHNTQPFVCSWVTAGGYCGEKFATSDDLMTHLRTHTTSLEQSALHNPLSPYSSLSLAGLPHLYPGLSSAASSLSPSALSRAYPRSLSPSSLLASSRFHPYMKPPALPALSTSLPSAVAGAHPPSLASSYPSLYPSLHGSRFGSALVP